MTNAQTQALLEKLTALEVQFLDYAHALRTRLSGTEVPDFPRTINAAHEAIAQKVSGMVSVLTDERDPVIRIDRIRNRGFASMSLTKRRRIAGRGGRNVHRLGRGHEFSREEARAAARISVRVRKGLQPHRNP